MEKLENSKCWVSYNEEDKNMKISGGDKTDQYNDPRFYSKSKRVKRGWEILKKEWNDSLTMYQVISLLDNEVSKINCHSYCAMD
jgi:hypothetical protein